MLNLQVYVWLSEMTMIKGVVNNLMLKSLTQ